MLRIPKGLKRHIRLYFVAEITEAHQTQHHIIAAFPRVVNTNPISPTKFGSLKIADHRLLARRKSISLGPKYTKVKRVISECQRFRPAGYNYGDCKTESSEPWKSRKICAGYIRSS